MYKINKKRFSISILLVVIAICASIATYVHFNSIDSKNNKLQSEQSVKKALVASNNVKNKNILEGIENSSNDQFSPAPFKYNGEVSFNKDEDYYKISQKDGIYFTTKTMHTFPYQKYKIRIEQDFSNTQKVHINWEGKSNRLVDLYAWDYTQQMWINIPESLSRDKDNLTIEAEISTQKFVKDNIANVMTAIVQKNNILPGKIPSEKEYDFTFAWLSDTQYYSASYPNIYDKMTKYIVDNKKEKNIVYAIHTGDLVDSVNELYQWKNADKSMKILDKAGIPYGVVSGNHDVGHASADYTNYFKYFGENRFSDKTFFGGTPNNNRDHYDLVSANGKDYIILYLGWSIQKNSFDWANEILKKYSNRKAILALHGYISMRGSYVEQGREVYEKIVSPNRNIFMVLCGHYGGAIVNVKRDDSRPFYEMLANYQFNPEGGAGYLRLLQFDAKNNLLYVNTYSPYKDDHNFYDAVKEEFILPLYDEHGEITLSTDYISIKP